MSRIKEISVKNLFGYLDYRIPLNNQEGITIIHGPNGCGKTWILQLISYVFTLNLNAIRSAPFEEIEFRFHDGGILNVHKEPEERPGQDFTLSESRWSKQFLNRLIFRYESTRTRKPKIYTSRVRMRFHPALMERKFPQFERIGPRQWLDHTRNELRTYENILDEYGDSIITSRGPEEPIPNWLDELSHRVNVSFIQSQRLIKLPVVKTEHMQQPRRDVTEMVELFSNDLAQRIQQTRAESVKIAQSRDRAFPTRLMRAEFSEITSEPQLREELSRTEEKRQELYSAGLLDQEEQIGRASCRESV